MSDTDVSVEPMLPQQWGMYGVCTLNKGVENHPIWVGKAEVYLGHGSRSRKAQILGAQGLLWACQELAKKNEAFRRGLIALAWCVAKEFP